ncbi:MAG TPA: deoxyguanosinetriphosphate triphosphohydrolase [Hypericibacter adhaerens]|uniref:deoxyguanosinetriphosphate triphosphohydrolase n=1 Tax=Hypericibacter adhaerens TaxID=2602016 RepID=UPI002C9D4983|nr:deoxyguanosinetriphosphate triphosphohydrolase [Hypericibacter adhaerens]HWA43218.1 deoxyguanosinetriphosphate triphosphohydrolase [Hypericibacter adhaerens]
MPAESSPLAPRQTLPYALQPYATQAAQSRGRLMPEPGSPTRSPFQRDRDRIIHSTAFRRLKHKTQVFVYHEGDYYRTRLTHSIEVAQIARSVSRYLGLDEDLAEAVALAHDLGHTPFGHAGEEALDAAMAPYGGFDHNAQTFRILTRLERHYAEFDGLNLTWECLEGVVKHNGPLVGPGASAKARARPVPQTIAEYSAQSQDLELDGWPGPEAQVAALADDIAYNTHDIDDGLRAGLFPVAALSELPLVGPVFTEVQERYPGIEHGRLVHESIRRLIDLMVSDLIRETEHRLAEAKPASVEALRRLGRPMVAFSDEMSGHDVTLKAFLFEHMYRHDRVTRMTERARRVVLELFGHYFGDPARLPAEWAAQCDGVRRDKAARVVADYIAGMTDRYALQEHERFFGRSSE